MLITTIILTLCISIHLSLSFGNAQPMATSIIIDYFKDKQITSLTILSTCWDLGLKGQIIKELSRNGFMVSYALGSVPYFPTYRMGVVFDITCDVNITQEIFDYIYEGKHFGLQTEWFLIDKSASNGKLTKSQGFALLEKSYILPGSAVTVAVMTKSTIQYLDVYRITLSSPLTINILGTGPLVNFTSLKPRKPRFNFRGETLKCGIFIAHPEEFWGFDNFEQDRRPDLSFWAKCHYAMVLNLAKQLNFTFTMDFISDVGKVLENGTFTGYIELISSEQVDFAGTGLIIREDRMAKLQFTSETFPFNSAIMFKRPSLSTLNNIFILPFSKNVWLCYLAMIFGAILVLWAGKVISHIIDMEAYTSTISVVDILTMVCGHVCQQGTNLEAKSLSARLTVFVFSLSTIFIYTAYTANIVSLLQLTSNSLRTIRDFTNSPLGLKIEWWPISDILFSEATDPDTHNLYVKKISPYGKNAYCELEEGMEMMKNEPMGYHVELDRAYKVMFEHFTESEKCGLGEIPVFFLPKLAFFVVKKSGYRELLTQQGLWQKEIGIVDRLSKIYFPQKPICEMSGMFRPVGFIDTKPAVMVLVYGVIIAFTIIILELVYNYRFKILSKFNSKILTKEY